MPSQKPIIGLTGAIGSGKSTVASILAQSGGLVIDADKNARQALNLPQVTQKITDWWGPNIIKPDKTPDRKAIAAIIFNDPDQKKRLENLIHPMVRQQQTKIIDDAQNDPAVDFIVLDVPLLVEVGTYKLCDHILFIEADRKTRLKRVQQSRHWTEQEMAQREKNQSPLDKKLKLAHHIIDNNSSETDCRTQVLSFLASIQS